MLSIVEFDWTPGILISSWVNLLPDPLFYLHVLLSSYLVPSPFESFQGLERKTSLFLFGISICMRLIFSLCACLKQSLLNHFTYIHVTHHHLVHLKLPQYYVNYISIKLDFFKLPLQQLFSVLKFVDVFLLMMFSNISSLFYRFYLFF